MDNKFQRRSMIDFANKLVDEIKAKAPKNTGNLEKSIDFNYVLNDRTDLGSVEIVAADYADFIDKGVNGKKRNVGSIHSFSKKKPPISALSDLANSIGISPYALQTSIFNKGFRGSFFITDSIDNNITEFAKDYTQAVWNDFAEAIKKDNL